MKKIVVIGSKGQLGSELQELSVQHPHHQFFFLDKEELDITNEAAVSETIAALEPDFLVNCAAYTAVDKAESDKDICYAINADAVTFLAKACAENHIKFIHISTDYVFDGFSDKGYKEDDVTNPQNVYGLSKLQGEVNALKNNPDAVIIRTAWVYSVYGANFVKTMLRLMQSKPEIGVVADQMGSPTYAADLAHAILQIIETTNWKPGVYHFTNEGVISWFEFAQAVKDISGADCKVNPITTEQYPTPAKRPKYSVLNKNKIQAAYAIRLQPWRESLEKCIVKLTNR